MVKALYVLPIAAFAAIAFANCSKTEGEITKINYSEDIMPAEQYEQILKMVEGNIPDEGIYVFSKEMNGGKDAIITHVDPDGTITPVSKEEFEAVANDKNHKDVVAAIMQQKEPEPSEPSEDEVYMIVEEMPEFPGGELELRRYIAEHVIYPQDAKAKNQQGKAFVKFVIDKNGDVKDAKIARSTGCESIDNEAVRVVKSLPQFKPGRQRGQNVNVSFTIPINFQLN